MWLESSGAGRAADGARRATRASIHRLHDVPPRKAPVHRALGERIEHLGRDDGVAYVALLQPGTDHPLGRPTAVAVRGVKVVDTRVPGVVHQGEGCLLVLSLPEKLRSRANPSESPAA